MVTRLAVVAMCLLCLCAGASAADEAVEKAAIREVIARMEVAWNRGDFRGYMEGLANPDVVFVSRGEFQASAGTSNVATFVQCSQLSGRAGSPFSLNSVGSCTGIVVTSTCHVPSMGRN